MIVRATFSLGGGKAAHGRRTNKWETLSVFAPPMWRPAVVEQEHSRMLPCHAKAPHTPVSEPKRKTCLSVSCKAGMSCRLLLSRQVATFALSRRYVCCSAAAQGQACSMADRLEITAVGAHMRGLPLNSQLTDLGATFVREAQTAPVYRLYSIGPRPLLVRQAQEDSNTASISLEVWSLPIESVGRFLAQIPSPLGLGTVLLSDGSTVKGFIGEAYAATQEGAEEITRHGGWRNYLASKST